ncbi:DUF3100 domain-containing protein [Arthrobacter monumenti]
MGTEVEKTAVQRARLADVVPILAATLVIAIVSELIGTVEIPVGPAAISIFPMVWGIIIGAIISIQKFKPMPLKLQRVANSLVGLFVLLLVARLAFNIGPSLRTVFEAGPALLLQEFGHLLGTIALALPLAVLLRMGKPTIGATFSLDREPAFAMVSEKYGSDSDQYRGVLAMYVFGTLFGAVYISLLAGLVTSLDIFDPLALAMGAGVGSGSMMAAATASIADAFPAQVDAVLALAAISNLITTVLGVYVGIYIALPLADKFYHFLTHKKTAAQAADENSADNRQFREAVSAGTEPITVPLWIGLGGITIIGIITASIVAGGFNWDIVLGYLTMDALLVISIALTKVMRFIYSIVWVTTIGALISSPWSPIGETLVQYVTAVDFLSIATVVLVSAGLSLGKDVPLLRQIGWKIVPVGIVAITASFVLATVIAEFSLGFWGV